jgi:hypothetical protein
MRWGVGQSVMTRLQGMGGAQPSSGRDRAAARRRGGSRRARRSWPVRRERSCSPDRQLGLCLRAWIAFQRVPGIEPTSKRLQCLTAFEQRGQLKCQSHDAKVNVDPQ